MQKNELPLAAAYVPDQPYVSLYSPADALRYGTVFPNLNKPYVKIVK